LKNAPSFHVTLIDNLTLPQRLLNELCFLFHQLRLTWVALKQDPLGFARQIVLAAKSELRRSATPSSVTALGSAVLLVFTAVLLLIWLGNEVKGTDPDDAVPGEQAQMITFLPNADASREGEGVGVGSKGRVGFRVGSGQGSALEVRRSTGGGTGGLHNPRPAQVGKPPQPSEIPAPIPVLRPVRNQALPVAGIDIDPALWQNLPMPVYGDPRSKSSEPSNGPGDGGGMGTNYGSGIGKGISGSGFGPGKDGNTGGGPKGVGCCGSGGSQGNNLEDPDRIYPLRQVTERARVLLKPEPQYTEAARRNAITGSVVLRVVFSRTGEVTNIRAIQALPFGLTERAITAARLIRFRPATRDGRPVNVYMQLEYNFNLY
jgi:TonB family protein